jgi:hypothetical protein
LVRESVIVCENCGKKETFPKDDQYNDLVNESFNIVINELDGINYKQMHFCDVCYELVKKMLIERGAQI